MNFSLVVLAAVIACTSALNVFNTELNGQWEAYKKEHNKLYEMEEEIARRLRWERNLEFIEKHNKEADNGVHTFRVGMNKYGDLTSEEFAAIFNGLRPDLESKTQESLHKSSGVAVPDSVDWRDQGYVTPVKDQGQCGSCWSFSATGSVEGQHFKKTGELVSLSEQNLMDCSRSFGNNGCQGGLMTQAFRYIESNGGDDTEASYPYEAKNGVCRFSSENVGATVSGYKSVMAESEEELTDAIATVGPISVAIDASRISFQLYESGLYYEPACSSTRLDHGVLAVGYGSMGDGQDYYIVKNSWGASWGDNGFVMMARNRNNNCGIATMASYPLV